MKIGPVTMNSGFNQHIGMTLLDFGPDGGSALVRIDERHHQPWGIVHGGLYCSIVETVASISGSVWLESQGGGSCMGVNNNTDFLRALSSGVVTATSTPIHRGRRQQLWLVEIVDEAHRPVARGQVRLHNT
jgi:1,4-dihydroxy-2-naphthoyl-CoA hydrolase